MGYIIKYKDNQYLSMSDGKKHSYTTNINQATHYDTEEAANKQISNSIKLASRIYHKVISDNDIWAFTPIADRMKEVCPDIMDKPVEDNYETIFETDEINITQTCTDISRFFKDVPIYRDRLSTQFKQVENECCDLRHRIEFPKDNGKEFNAIELASLCKRYRDTLRKRRQIKDDVARLDIIADSKLEDYTSERICKRIDGLDSRTYSPRVLTELF